jgi:hypothetical protein
VVLDPAPLFAGIGFACFPFVTSLGLKNYVIQASAIKGNDQCSDARWTALSDAQVNIQGMTQPATRSASLTTFVQAVVKSWEDGSTRTRIWTDPSTQLTVQR